jgi:hypothetical protein
MLQISLRDYADSTCRSGWKGSRTPRSHAAPIGRLVAASPPRDFPLKPDYVNIVLWMQRA